jgi:hypothetical protein
LFLAGSLAMQGQPAFAEVVEQRSARIVLRRRPIKSVRLQPRVLGIELPASTEQGIETRAASDRKGRVRIIVSE